MNGEIEENTNHWLARQHLENLVMRDIAHVEQIDARVVHWQGNRRAARTQKKARKATIDETLRNHTDCGDSYFETY